MKISNLKAVHYKAKNVKYKNITQIDEGITKRLLEKYKPKHIFSVESQNNRKYQKKNGLRS